VQDFKLKEVVGAWGHRMDMDASHARPLHSTND